MPSLPNRGCLTHLLGSPHQATRSKTASPPPAFLASCPLLAFSLLALTTARYTTHRESRSSFTACLPHCITSSRRDFVSLVHWLSTQPGQCLIRYYVVNE